MTTALITGISGFVGSHLAEYLIDNTDWNIVGMMRWRSPLDNIQSLIPEINKGGRVRLVYADLRDGIAVREAVEQANPTHVFHLAAQSYPKTSFSSPLDTLDTNVQGTVRLLDALRKSDAEIHVCSCHDAETMLITQRGIVHFTDIRADDKVITFDKTNGDVRYATIKRVVVSEYDGELVHIKNRSVDQFVTRNHRIISRSQPSEPMRDIDAGEISGNRARYYLPHGRRRGEMPVTIPFGGKEWPACALLYFLGLYIGDGYSDHQAHERDSKTGLDRATWLRRARAGNGTFAHIDPESGRKNVCNSYRVFLAIPRADKARASAETCLTELGVTWHAYDKELFFTSREMVSALDEFTHSAHTKHIPDWLLQYDAAWLDHLYRGIIDSDGYYTPTGGHRLTTVSDRLRDDFIRLCLFVGKHPSSCRTQPSTPIIKDRVIKSTGAHQIHASDGERLFQAKDVKLETYKGSVWCLEIEDTHNFAVWRNGRVCFSGNSSEVYGRVPKERVPIDEDCPFHPASPYAISKIGTDLVARHYAEAYEMKIMVTRLFTHTGPGRGDVFFESSFAKQIAMIEAGLIPPVVKHGNLDSLRTIADVRDAVRAYHMLLTVNPTPGEVYNIGGTHTCKVGDVLDALIAMSTVSPISKEQDPERMRPLDADLQVPDCSKFKGHTGWNPLIPFEQTMSDLLQYWRKRITTHAVLQR